MSRQPRGSRTSGRRKRTLLARLQPDEAARVLRALLERHPDLAAEADQIARAALTEVDAGAVAGDVEQAVLELDLDDLGTRSGRKSWGYVEPTEAAWELLEEALAPFIEEMKRHVELGFEAAAAATCAGIVLGLHRCRVRNSDQVLGWAEDFPAEAAGDAAATLARLSRAKHRHAWRLPDAVVEQVPDWADLIRRASNPSARAF